MRSSASAGLAEGSCGEAVGMRLDTETNDSPPLFSDLTQQRYELIRPLLLDPARTATQRAPETGVHPDTVGQLKRRFAQQGMLGLVTNGVSLLQTN